MAGGNFCLDRSFLSGRGSARSNAPYLHVGAPDMATKTGVGRSGNTSNRGFASMDQEKQRELARKGGQSVAPEDRTFSKTPELAAEAGRKGGQNVDSAARSFSKDPELAAKAGRKGGQHSHGGSAGAEGGNRSDRGGGPAEDRERAAGAGRKRGQPSNGDHS